MRAGALRHRVTLQPPTKAADGQGGRTVDWTAGQITGVQAAVEPMRGREALEAAKVTSTVPYEITLRYSSAVAAVAPTWRVVFGARTFQVHGVVNRDLRNRELQLVCSEVQA